MKRDEDVTFKVARIHAGLLAIVVGSIFGVTLLLMTTWLLLKNGEDVGTHLQLLANYFPGYSVSWTGSLLGFVYGAVTGGFLGWLIGITYNFVVDLRS